jgi:hypothetical protein
MPATDFFSSHSYQQPFVRLDDGTYRYLRREWESQSPPTEEHGPDAGWVERGLECGDVVRLEILRDLTLHLVNRMMPA